MVDALRDNRGNRYPTEEAAAAATARNEQDDAARAATEATRAADWEAGLKDRYLSTPGATEADWTRNRQAVIDAARQNAALATDDAVREANARRYAQ